MAKAKAAGIPELRQKIDALDDRLLELLEERAALAKAVGEEKRKRAGAPEGPRFYDAERERQIMARLDSRARDEFPRRSIPFVFKEVISACRSLETEMRVAFLGPPGTYTQIAAHQTFGQSIELVEVSTIQDVFQAVSRDQAEYGIVPLENSFEGGVAQTLEALAETELMIRAQTTTEIHHCLLSQARELGAIRRVHSHPHALAQCRRWLAENLPQAELVPAKSTAAAARTVQGEADSAAIASRLSGELFGLHLLREKIQNQLGNATRFILLHRSDAPRTGRDRTSLVLTCKGGEAELPKVLDVFGQAKVELLRLETRPDSRDAWRYLFFLDLAGHRTDTRLKKALAAAAKRCESFRVLGSYPA
jgi:chorismate mutase/prephenate dehydratase